ncbi:MAG: tetratricopeptide repeat protein, partial [Gemmatimonadales bacterium]|nr:tetratricopeptide repeat protein [Gemmatimonadales bacterium]NIN10698.1 tetratricopeptide repeat protein [Gemmatimonadales bacterium]NIN49026.1 tetratricopeptide repeat protein [Gemmatimonadales bacterium]NIP06490.1 tetratricopeptide repeat protein [Gemmatimonadales bacterium]NIQ98835.1 tetratricopeptide repeat protein [Gemmatimonadales bacterium]
HVIHRDVKPENILLHEGEAMVADFGIALAVAAAGGERLTETGLSLGTPEYMSPEQATGDPHLDARSDIYSLGCVLFEMLAGEPPYTGSTAQVVISKRLTEPLPRLGAVRDTVSVAVEQAVTRALEKVPADRYRTAEEFAEALARASTGEAVPGRALGPAEASEPMQGRSWRRVAAAVMAGIGLIGATWWVVTTIAPGSGAIERLAVLPLENLTGDPEQEYFVEGMHDALINELGQIRALTVISRRSAMRYRDTDKSVPEIARELSVDAVVEGSALQVGDRVRISAQLIEAATDRQLWANDYERDMRDVLSLHKEVARDIADQIRVTLTPQEESGLESAPPVNQEVYELYLKGRHLCVKWTPEDGNKAIEYLQQAIEIDRSYAPSYGELAICYVLLGFFDYLLPQEAYPKARAAATRALDADERLPEAHVALGAVSWYFDWNAPEAEREYKRAVELNPSHSDAHLWLAFFLGEIGRWDEAIAAARRAQELDPLSVMANNAAGEVFYLKREYDRAAEAFGKNLDLEPTNAGNHYYIAWPYEQQGMYEEAIAELETAVRLSQGLPI